MNERMPVSDKRKMMPQMLTLSKASELTGVPYCALRRWIKSGEFTYYVMVGSKHLINLERLVDFLNAPAVCGGSNGRTGGKL